MPEIYSSDTAVDAGLSHIKENAQRDNELPNGVRDALLGLAIQGSSVTLPYGGEKMAAFKAAQTAREIHAITNVQPGDIL